MPKFTVDESQDMNGATRRTFNRLKEYVDDGHLIKAPFATSAETLTGTNSVLAVTPSGVKAATARGFVVTASYNTANSVFGVGNPVAVVPGSTMVFTSTGSGNRWFLYHFWGTVGAGFGTSMYRVRSREDGVVSYLHQDVVGTDQKVIHLVGPPASLAAGTHTIDFTIEVFVNNFVIFSNTFQSSWFAVEDCGPV